MPADWGIRSNVIEPGWIETDLTAAMSSNPIMRRIQHGQQNHTVLLRRPGQGDDITGPALFFASDESSYITGPRSWSTVAGSPPRRTWVASDPITCSACWRRRRSSTVVART